MKKPRKRPSGAALRARKTARKRQQEIDGRKPPIRQSMERLVRQENCRGGVEVRPDTFCSQGGKASWADKTKKVRKPKDLKKLGCARVMGAAKPYAVGIDRDQSCNGPKALKANPYKVNQGNIYVTTRPLVMGRIHKRTEVEARENRDKVTS